MKIGIKVGSNLLVEEVTGGLQINHQFIDELCEQIACMWQMGHKIFLVTSGAVASNPVERRSKNLRAAIGQHLLMQVYASCLRKYGLLEIAPIVVTDYDLLHPDVFIDTVIEAFDEGVVPIVNANDPVSNSELKNLAKCTDNDHLFALACKALRLDLAIMGIDQPGLLDDQNQVVRCVSSQDEETYRCYARGASQLGQGGMLSKLSHLCFLARNNIIAIMVPAHEPCAFLRGVSVLMGRGLEKFGTVFLP